MSAPGIKKLLIANRGEIAVRIIRAARKMGIATVQVYSSADADSLAVQMADETVEIGPPQAAKSHLNADAILAAAHAIGALGGVDGRAIQPGDTLPVGASARSVKEGRPVPQNLRRGPGTSAELRMLPGLYWHRITAAAQDGFFADTWKVANEADRMGYRFQGGKPLEFVPREQPYSAGSDPSNITDACYPYGSVQVPSGTEPIVLHRDAVSGGGYFMIGTVISADMDLIGQLQPNTEARFVRVDMEAALAARHARSTTLNAIRSNLEGV